MQQHNPNLIKRVGVDLAKNVYQIHAVNQLEAVVLAKPMTPQKFFEWCAQLPANCLVAMEGCSSAHHVSRRLSAMGLTPRILAAHHVTPYRVTGLKAKNDANDAAAICEAASRPHLHNIPIKTAQQQGILALHRLREGYKEERTAIVNRIRGLLSEFGIVFAQSPEALQRGLPDVLEDAQNELPSIARLALQQAAQHWQAVDEQMKWCELRINEHARTDVLAQKASVVLGIGPLTASAIVATAGDLTQFKTAKQFGSWLGLVPSQNSSGGKTRLGRITCRGESYLRTLLVQGAKSVYMSATKRDDRTSQWVLKLKERKNWQKAIVALANKNARTLWCLLTRGSQYDPNHVPALPLKTVQA
jgi:transposase